jgi:DNA-binding CsgD family transcriptional regulator
MAAEGHSNAEIARALGLTPGTVRTYRSEGA